MINLKIKLIWPGYAEGRYVIKAKGYILAVLRWGDKHGVLEDWGVFAYVPIDPAGNGSFYFPNARGIPRGATHVYAHCLSSDFLSYEDVFAEIPPKFLYETSIPENAQKFSVLTDLHLASKPRRIKNTLSVAHSEKILLLGDIINDGLSKQFEQFEECIKETASDKIILPVIGNHDVLHDSHGDIADGCCNYEEFQKYLLSKVEDKGFTISYDPNSLAYSIRFENIDIIGIQCVISGRKFSFPEGKQILWLENYLKENQNSSWHLILCHAPLLTHNPNRNTGNPYLAKDKMLQEIIDNCGNVIFLSGHTHVSPNSLIGNAEFLRGNIYLNCGSAVDTDTSGEQGLMSHDWNDGCITELLVSDSEVEICTSSVKTGIKFPRGYYRFNKADIRHLQTKTS